VGLLAAAVAFVLYEGTRPAIAGQVRITEIRIAPEVGGRVASFRVKAGDAVDQGTVLAELDNPELAAAVIEARAAVGEARAARDRVYAGVRSERIAIAERAVAKARSNLALAQQEYDRVAALATRSNASRQDLDTRAAQLDVAGVSLAVAQLDVAAARVGPTAEERALADAGVALAEASLAVLERRAAKTVLTAPVRGTVGILVAEPGEAMVPGRPVLTLETADASWFTFIVREDQLPGITIGAGLELVVENTGKAIPARITEIRALGEFATWRAARAAGDHDLNSFLVRADPAGDAPDLQPGMTVWLSGGAR
jgi:HlyD family secretion protein